MSTTIHFRSRDDCRIAYGTIINYYRRRDSKRITTIKLSGNNIIVPELDNLEEILDRTKLKYKIK